MLSYPIAFLSMLIVQNCLCSSSMPFWSLFSVSFRLPMKLATLRKHVKHGSATGTIKRYVVCPTCRRPSTWTNFLWIELTILSSKLSMTTSARKFATLANNCLSAPAATMQFPKRSTHTILSKVLLPQCSVDRNLSLRPTAGDLDMIMLE